MFIIEHLDHIRNTANRYFKHRQIPCFTVDDLVNETCIKMLKHPYDPTKSGINTYIYVLMNSVHLDMCRSAKNYYYSELTDNHEEPECLLHTMSDILREFNVDEHQAVQLVLEGHVVNKRNEIAKLVKLVLQERQQ